MSVAFRRDVLGASATIRVEVSLGADVYANPAVWIWTDITADVLQSASGGLVNITPMGRSDEYSTSSPAGCTFQLRNSTSSFGAGTWTAYNPTSQFYPYVRQNTPVRVVVNLTGNAVDDSIRFQGYVNGWKPSWDTSGKISIVAVSASGVTRRTRQGVTSDESPIRRSTLAAQPVVYAPMEEPAGSTVITILDDNGTAIGDAAFGAGVTAGTADTTLLGSRQAAVLTASSYLNINPENAPAGNAKFNNHWQIDWFTFFPSDPGAEMIIMRGYTDSPQVQLIDAVFGGGIVGIRTYGPGGDTGNVVGIPTFPMSGRWIHWRLMAQASAGGTDTDYLLVFFPIIGNGAFVSLTVASTVPGNSRGASILPQAAFAGVGMAHWAIYNRYNFSAVNNSASGYTGETATARITRICREEGFPLDLTGSSTVRMGAQPISTALAVLRECEAADGGILCDGRSAGITYVSHSARYNQAVALTLDAAAREVTGSLDTVDDDQRRRNRDTASRTGGGSVTFEQPDGALGSTTIGLYDTSGSANVERDTQLYQLASWVVHLGQADGFRYPRLDLNLVGTATLTGSTSVPTEWLACDPGSRIDVINTRDKAPTRPPGDVRVLLEGWSETLGPKVWTASANCSSYDPWSTGTTTTGTPEGWVDCGASITVSTMTTSSTTVDVGVNDACSWTHADGNFFITIGGEDMLVTAVGSLTASTPTFGAAGTDAHAEGHTIRTVTPGMPASLAAGNLMLLFATCRDTNSDPDIYLSGVSVQDSPSGKGWKKLIEGRNFCVFAKVATASETAPTVNIDSTIFGDTLQAVIVRYAGKWGDPVAQLIDFEQTLNGTAQNINYPGMQVPLSSCMIFYFGWRADDWTGAATIAGAAEAFDIVTTDSNDSGIAMDYVYSAAATAISAGSFTITGGSSTNISRGCVFAMRTAFQTLTVTRAQNDTVARAHILGEEVHTTFPLLASRD